MTRNVDLALALDFTHRDDALKCIKQFQERPVVFKLGVQLLPHLQKSDFEDFKKQNLRIFVDAKLHDIPSQVESAVKSWASLGVDFLTLHLSGGKKMLEGAVKSTQGSSLKLLGVSVLTSSSESELKDLGLNVSPQDHVKRLVGLGVAAGLHSFVSSVHEVALIRSLDANAYVVTPGVQIDTQQAARLAPDQSRVASVQDALIQKSSMIVMGRGILKANDPHQALDSVLQMLAKG